MNNLGWISLHRQILNSWLWEDKPFTYGQAWIDMLLMANHQDNEILFEGDLITVKRGSFHSSIIKMSERYGWNRKKTTKFLNLLEKQQMVTTIRTTHGTTVNIVKYDIYQNSEQQYGQPQGQAEDKRRTSEGQAKDTNNNDNNVNNANNIFICSEPDKSALNPSGIELILNDNSIYDVSMEMIETWRKAYPAVNIEHELYKMRAWLQSNPSKRKTSKGINRFINNWLAREQDKGGIYKNSQQEKKKDYGDFNVKLWEEPEDSEGCQIYVGGKKWNPKELEEQIISN